MLCEALRQRVNEWRGAAGRILPLFRVGTMRQWPVLRVVDAFRRWSIFARGRVPPALRTAAVEWGWWLWENSFSVGLCVAVSLMYGFWLLWLLPGATAVSIHYTMSAAAQCVAAVLGLFLVALTVSLGRYTAGLQELREAVIRISDELWHSKLGTERLIKVLMEIANKVDLKTQAKQLVHHGPLSGFRSTNEWWWATWALHDAVWALAEGVGLYAPHSLSFEESTGRRRVITGHKKWDVIDRRRLSSDPLFFLTTLRQVVDTTVWNASTINQGDIGTLIMTWFSKTFYRPRALDMLLTRCMRLRRFLGYPVRVAVGALSLALLLDLFAIAGPDMPSLDPAFLSANALAALGIGLTAASLVFVAVQVIQVLRPERGMAAIRFRSNGRTS